MELLNGKKGIIMGVANDHSIAWGIAQALHQAGAELAFTYQGQALEKRIRPLAASIGSDILVPCDVADDASMISAFEQLQDRLGTVDFLVHAIAFSDRNELKGNYINTTRENFLNTLHISCYSFTQACRLVAPFMQAGGSCLTLTYLGADKFIPNYNVMGVAKAALQASVRYLAYDLGSQGVRVNALSAGPIRTLAASGIGDFRVMLDWNKNNNALGRNITTEDIGKTALYLLSDMASGITGETVFVDGGYHHNGMMNMAHITDNMALLNQMGEE